MTGGLGTVLLTDSSEPGLYIPSFPMMLSYLAVALCTMIISRNAYIAIHALRSRRLRPWHLLTVAAPTAVDAVILFGFWSPQRAQASSISGSNPTDFFTKYPTSDSLVNMVEYVMLQAMLAVGVITLICLAAGAIGQRLESSLSPLWPPTPTAGR